MRRKAVKKKSPIKQNCFWGIFWVLTLAKPIWQFAQNINRFSEWLEIKGIWQKIQQTVTGTQFNFDFWEKCSPRRSTYQACRAVIAARNQGNQNEEPMILAIQQAYYLKARNPADLDTLIELADQIGLDHERFIADITSHAVNQMLMKEIAFMRQLGVKGFPTMLLENKGQFTNIAHDYKDTNSVLNQIKLLCQ